MTIAGRIKHLEKEHAEIDKKIDGMEKNGVFSDDHLMKLKKQRLHIKEDLVKLQEQLARGEANDQRWL
jgi:hypothetical protein